LSNRRFLVIGSFEPGSLAESYSRALERLGWDVFRFDSMRAIHEAGIFSSNRLGRRILRGKYWNRVNLATLEISRAVQPAMVLAVKCCYLHPETVRRLRVVLGVPVINYYPDNPYCGVPLDPREGASTQRRDLLEVFKEYTGVWVWEEVLAGRLRKDGVTANYLPFGVDDKLFHPYPDKPYECGECRTDHEVVFVGHFNKKRGKHVEAIKRNRVSLWGQGWNRLSPSSYRFHGVHRNSVFGQATASLHSNAVVSLNVVGDLNMPGHNMRTFEIPASGGVMLSHFTSEQDAFFPEGEAAVYYRAPEELDHRIENMIFDKELRERIRRNGVKLAAKHTYMSRASVLLQNYGISI